jgi:hypothetical protein
MTSSVIGKLRSKATAPRGARHRPALLVLLGWLLLAQTLLVVHTVDHAKVENGAPCALCIAGDHLAGAGTTPVLHLPPPTPNVVASTVDGTVILPLRAVYRSRAPPTHLRTC